MGSYPFKKLIIKGKIVVGVVLKGLFKAANLAWKNKLLLTGGAAAADQYYNDGKGRRHIFNEYVKPEINDVSQKLQDDNALFDALLPDVDTGRDDKKSKNAEIFGVDLKAAGVGALAGFVSKWLTGKILGDNWFGNIGKWIAGIAATYFIYNNLKEGTKNSFNSSAENTGPDHTADVKKKNSPVSAEFSEKGSELPSTGKDVKNIPASIGNTDAPAPKVKQTTTHDPSVE